MQHSGIAILSSTYSLQCFSYLVRKIILYSIDTKLYSSCAVVKFESDLQAAGVVQYENGARHFGSNVNIKHAEPNMLWSLEQSENRGRVLEDTNAFAYDKRFEESSGPSIRHESSSRSPSRLRSNRG